MPSQYLNKRRNCHDRDQFYAFPGSAPGALRFMPPAPGPGLPGADQGGDRVAGELELCARCAALLQEVCASGAANDLFIEEEAGE